MAKKATTRKKKVNLPSSVRRDNRIKNCETCKGKPETKKFKAEPFEGVCCKECLEIVSYKPLNLDDDLNKPVLNQQGLPSYLDETPVINTTLII